MEFPIDATSRIYFVKIDEVQEEDCHDDFWQFAARFKWKIDYPNLPRERDFWLRSPVYSGFLDTKVIFYAKMESESYVEHPNGKFGIKFTGFEERWIPVVPYYVVKYSKNIISMPYVGEVRCMFGNKIYNTALYINRLHARSIMNQKDSSKDICIDICLRMGVLRTGLVLKSCFFEINKPILLEPTESNLPDYCITVEDKYFSCRKECLRQQCEYFRIMFAENPDSRGKDIDFAQPTVMEVFLEMITNGRGTVISKMIPELYDLARKLGTPEVMEECIFYAITSKAEDFMFEMFLQDYEMWQVESVQWCVVIHIIEYSFEVFTCEQWRIFKRNRPFVALKVLKMAMARNRMNMYM